MLEVDIFVPLKTPKGKRPSNKKITALKKRLLRQFGGVTFFPQSNEGLWKLGNYVYRDKIVIFRVLAAPGQRTRKFFRGLKKELELEWDQENVLILSRWIKFF